MPLLSIAEVFCVLVKILNSRSVRSNADKTPANLNVVPCSILQTLQKIANIVLRLYYDCLGLNGLHCILL